MKSLAIAGALAVALALTALPHRAAAQECGQRGFEISAGISASIGVHWTPGERRGRCRKGGDFGCDGSGYPCMGGYGAGSMGCPYPAYGYVAPQFTAPQPAAAPAQAAPAGPALPMPTPKKESKETTDVQNVGYNYPVYPAAYGYNYNYAPWYYGYPYYQAYGYWYGYGR